MASVLDDLSGRIQDFGDVLNQNANYSQDPAASTQFALANNQSLGQGDRLTYAQLFNSISPPQGSAPDTVPGDGVVGDSTPVNPTTKHRGFLAAVGNILKPLGAVKRFTDHLSRLAAASGIPGLAQVAPPLLGATVGGLIGAAEGLPFGGFGAIPGALAGAAIGATTMGGVAAIEHANKGDLSQAWKATKTGKTFGQIVATSAGVNQGSVPYKLLSGTADLGLSVADDPTSYIAPYLKSVRGAKAITDLDKVEEMVKAAPTQRWLSWAKNIDNANVIRRSALAQGVVIPERTAVALADAKNLDEATQALVEGASKVGAVNPATGAFEADRQVMNALPSFYKSPLLRAVQAWHAWEGPSLLHVTPRAEFDLEASDAVQQAERHFETSTWRQPGEGLLASRGRGLAERNEMMDQFLRADNNGKLALVKQATVDAMKNAGLDDAAIQRIAAQKGWHGLAELPEASKQLNMFGGLKTDATSLVLPDYRDMRVLRGLKGTGSVEQTAANLMKGMKKLWITRPAFALRISMDEFLNAAAQFSFKPMEYLHHMSNTWIKHLTADPTGFQNAIGEQLQNFMEHIGNLPGFSSLKPGDLDHLADVKYGPLGALREEGPVTTVRGKELGPEYPRRQLLKAADMGTLRPGDLGHERAWLQSLNYDIRNSGAGHLALENFENPIEARNVLTEFAKTEEGVAEAAKNGFTDPQAYATFRHGQVFGENAVVPPDLRPQLATRNLGMEDIKSVPHAQRPTVNGYTSFTKMGKLASFEEGFHTVVGTWLNNMVREPLWRQQYDAELERITQLAEQSGGIAMGEVSADDLSRAAANKATTDLMKVAHNPLEKTRLDVINRSLVPFSYAHIQFLKRWERALVAHPEFVRRMGILAGVGQQDGFFDTDSRGNLLWHFPVGNEFIKHYMSIGLNRTEDLPFMAGPLKAFQSAAVPALMPFSANVMPGLSPFVTIPASYLTMKAPTLDKGLSHVLGPSFGQLNQSGMGFMDRALSSVAPSWVKRLSDAFTGDQRDNLYGKAYIDALRYHGFKGEDITSPKVKDRVQRETRLMFAAYGVMSAFSPYTPMPDLESMAPAKELAALRAKFGPEVGSVKFLEKYGPKAESQLTPLTKSTGKGLDASKEFQTWADQNPGFLAKYPNVGGLLGPRGAYNQFAYDEQKIKGKRVALSPTEWVAEVAIRRGDDEFFAKGGIKEKYDLLRKVGVSAKDLSPWYSKVKQNIEDKNPGWLAWREGGQSREKDRQAAIVELGQAINDPNVPQVKGLQDLRKWFTLYNTMGTILKSYGVQSLSSRAAHDSGIRDALVATYRKMQNTKNPQPLDEAYRTLFRSELQDFTSGD